MFSNFIPPKIAMFLMLAGRCPILAPARGQFTPWCPLPLELTRCRRTVIPQFWGLPTVSPDKTVTYRKRPRLDSALGLAAGHGSGRREVGSVGAMAIVGIALHIRLQARAIRLYPGVDETWAADRARRRASWRAACGTAGVIKAFARHRPRLWRHLARAAGWTWTPRLHRNTWWTHSGLETRFKNHSPRGQRTDRMVSYNAVRTPIRTTLGTKTPSSGPQGSSPATTA